ncbi:MAG: SRPBCC family protein, partial [Pseudomonadota bacterium]
MTELHFERVVKAQADTAWAVIAAPAAPATLSPQVRRVEVLEAPAGHIWRRCYDHGDRVWEERSVEPVQGDSFTMDVEAPAFSWMLRRLRCTYSVRSTTAGVELGLR